MRFSIKKNINPNELVKLWEALKWDHRTRNKWKELLSKSNFIYSAWNGQSLVGFGRILDDGIMCMFYDICVHPNFQRQGIGTKILKRLVKQIKNKKYTSIGLFISEDNPSARNFYEKFGFKRVKNGMELLKYMNKE